MDMVTEMIRKEFGVTVRARTLRRWLRRIGFSWRKGQVRPVQVSLQREARGVQKGGRGARVPEARGRHDRLCRGRSRGPKVPEPRLRVEADRGREQVRASFSRESVRIFGAMSQDELRIKIVESTNSETFREFLEEIRRDRPRLFMVLDNASYHKS